MHKLFFARLSNSITSDNRDPNNALNSDMGVVLGLLCLHPNTIKPCCYCFYLRFCCFTVCLCVYFVCQWFTHSKIKTIFCALSLFDWWNTDLYNYLQIFAGSWRIHTLPDVTFQRDLFLYLQLHIFVYNKVFGVQGDHSLKEKYLICFGEFLNTLWLATNKHNYQNKYNKLYPLYCIGWKP